MSEDRFKHVLITCHFLIITIKISSRYVQFFFLFLHVKGIYVSKLAGALKFLYEITACIREGIKL